MKLIAEIISIIIAALGFLWGFSTYYRGQLDKFQEHVYSKIKEIEDDCVKIQTCKLIHAGTSKDIDRLEAALKEGFKSVYEKIDKLSEVLTQTLTNKKGE